MSNTHEITFHRHSLGWSSALAVWLFGFIKNGCFEAIGKEDFPVKLHQLDTRRQPFGVLG